MVKMVDLNSYHKFDLKMPYLTIDHGANSKVSMVMVNFLTIDHGPNSRVSWSWSVPYPPPPPSIRDALSRTRNVSNEIGTRTYKSGGFSETSDNDLRVYPILNVRFSLFHKFSGQQSNCSSSITNLLGIKFVNY